MFNVHLSYNDCKLILQRSSDFTMMNVHWSYNDPTLNYTNNLSIDVASPSASCELRGRATDHPLYRLTSQVYWSYTDFKLINIHWSYNEPTLTYTDNLPVDVAYLSTSCKLRVRAADRPLYRPFRQVHWSYNDPTLTLQWSIYTDPTMIPQWHTLITYQSKLPIRMLAVNWEAEQQITLYIGLPHKYTDPTIILHWLFNDHCAPIVVHWSLYTDRCTSIIAGVPTF